MPLRVEFSGFDSEDFNLLGAQPEDSGVYICTVTADNGETTSAQAQIIIGMCLRHSRVVMSLSTSELGASQSATSIVEPCPSTSAERF